MSFALTSTETYLGKCSSLPLLSTFRDMISCLPLASILPKYWLLLVLLQCYLFLLSFAFLFPHLPFSGVACVSFCLFVIFLPFSSVPLPLFFQVQQNSFPIRQSLVTCTCHLEITARPCEWRPWVLVIHLHTRCMPSLKTNVLGFLDVEFAASLKDWKEIDVTG